MEYNTFSGFDGEGDDCLYVEIRSDGGEHLRYLDESELKDLEAVVTEWLTKHKPLWDICGCGAYLDSHQDCERGDECPESEGYECAEEDEDEDKDEAEVEVETK